MASGYDDPQVTGATLRANLAYLGAQAEGKSHEQSIGRSIAITAKGWVDSVDINRTNPPTDELSARTIAQPAGKAVSADIVPLPKLPTSKHVKTLANTYGNPMRDPDYASLSLFPDRIAQSHAAVDQSVTATKQRRSKPFGPKEDVPRNRSVVSHYVVHATAMAAGAARAADAAGLVNSLARQAQPLLGADYRGNEAAPVKSLLTRLGTSIPVLAVTIAGYKKQLEAATWIVPQTRHADAQGLTDAVAAVREYLDKALERLGETKKMDLQKAAAQLKANPM
jgi:hypothetical protein